MIEASFKKRHGEHIGFSVKGHSGYDDSGYDIVCASVSSAVMLTCNAVTEIFKIKAEVSAGDSIISCEISDSKEGSKLLEALRLHLSELSCDYPENITVKISEV